MVVLNFSYSRTFLKLFVSDICKTSEMIEEPFKFRSCRRRMAVLHSLLAFVATIVLVESAEITPPDFQQTPTNNVESLLPAAFADIDGDRFTDIILLTADHRRLVTLLGQRDDPVVISGPPIDCQLPNGERMFSVVPGDFDGDETVDILVTTSGAKDHFEEKDERSKLSLLRIFWGLGDGKFKCPDVDGGQKEDMILFDVSSQF